MPDLDIFENIFDKKPSELPELDGPVLICICYNEILRLPDFIRHHRNIGFKHFIFIDNGSDDGTYEYLRKQDDVLLFLSHRQYREYKSKWRKTVADVLADNRWVLFADVDELFVYTGWPQKTINVLIDELEEEGANTLFCSMVDMYRDRSDGKRYKSGQSMLAHSAAFDGDGYWMMPVSRRYVKRFPSPPFHLYGGARLRVLRGVGRTFSSRLAMALIQRLYPIKSAAGLCGGHLCFKRMIYRQLKRYLPKEIELMSKVAFLRWDATCDFPGGVHSLRTERKLSSMWGALLHFKYLDDIESKIEQNIERAQHANDGFFYKEYKKNFKEINSSGGMKYAQTKTFRDVGDLEAVGLIRPQRNVE